MLKRDSVYDTYWYFAAARQELFWQKYQGHPPHTADPILKHYKFCNTYRINDRVSQFLVGKVIYSGPFTELDLLLRIILFRLFNKIDTWEYLEETLGEITAQAFDTELYSKILARRSLQTPIYGNAFILCANKAFGFDRKHDNHLHLLKHILSPSVSEPILQAKSLEQLFLELRQLPLLGNFMAYQIAIDLNYSNLFNFSESEFTVAGPGAIRGIRKAFTDIGSLSTQDVIMYMVDNQDAEFARLEINFRNLFGRRLQAIDCQGLFCELDKYSRVKFPELKSNRQQIKSTYTVNPQKIDYIYPPKWKLNSVNFA